LSGSRRAFGLQPHRLETFKLSTSRTLARAAIIQASCIDHEEMGLQSAEILVDGWLRGFLMLRAYREHNEKLACR